MQSLRVVSSASDRQGSNFEFCVWMAVSSHSSHHPHEVFLAQFSLYLHKGGLKPHLFQFIFVTQFNISSRVIVPLKPEFTIVIFIHYKPQIAVAIIDL